VSRAVCTCPRAPDPHDLSAHEQHMQGLLVIARGVLDDPWSATAPAPTTPTERLLARYEPRARPSQPPVATSRRTPSSFVAGARSWGLFAIGACNIILACVPPYDGGTLACILFGMTLTPIGAVLLLTG
jgi:hypothetical protein